MGAHRRRDISRVARQIRGAGLRAAAAANEPPTDGALLARVARGKLEAMETLAGRYERLLLGVALGLVGDEATARDCVQDAWVRVIRGAGTFRGEGGAKSWLVTVLVNATRDRGRREGRRREVHRSFALAQDASGADTASEPGDAGVRDATLRRALATLRDEDREVVLLCACRSLTHDEAADALGIPVGTLKSRLYRSLAKLRVELEGTGLGGEETSEGLSERGGTRGDGA